MKNNKSPYMILTGKMINSVAFALLLVATTAAQAVWAGPLAASAEVDKKFAMFVKPQERSVPDAQKVGIAAYPVSSFCTIKEGKWGPDGWSEIRLLSTESYEKVVAWYRDHLDGWFCSELTPGASTRCSDKDPGEAGVYDPETFNVVNISKTNIAMPCVLEGMQTGITIQFQPD